MTDSHPDSGPRPDSDPAKESATEPDSGTDSTISPDLAQTLPVTPGQELEGLDPRELIEGGLQSRTNPNAWVPPTPEELSRLLPQYEIDALLGRGGMGAVYRGRQATLDRKVAIKLLPSEMAADADFVARFEREARTLAKLHHPGIVLVHDFGQTEEGHLYFVMEFVDGTDLYKIIHGPGLDCAQALEIVTQVCDALHYAHGMGVVHRDIKPANVIVALDGRAKLADFGLARPIDDGSGVFTQTNVVMGTPDYMAPEALAGEADHRADLYSLGVMFYEMLTGKPPRGAWDPPSQRVQVDVRLDEVVIRALQEDPEKRYQQASEIKTDVEGIRSTPMPKAAKGKRRSKATPASAQKTAESEKKRSRMGIAAVGLAVAVGFGLFLPWALKDRESKAGEIGTASSFDGATVNHVRDVQPEPQVIAARERGGRLRVFGSSHSGEKVELGKAAAYDDFQTVVVSRVGWAARRKGGDTFCMAGLDSLEWATVELGPFHTTFLQRDLVPVMQMSGDGSYRNVFGKGTSQHRKDWADLRAVAFLNAGGYDVMLDRDGTILRGEHWDPSRTDRLPPPEDFFLGATAYDTVRDHYVSARPGLPVRSFSVSTGALIDFPDEIRDIVEMDANGYDEMILRNRAGEVFVVTQDGQPYGTVPPDATPAVAVRAGVGVFAAQRPDGTWRAWGDSNELVSQTTRIGHAIDIDFHRYVDFRSDGSSPPAYMMWIEPVDDAASPAEPSEATIPWREMSFRVRNEPFPIPSDGWIETGSGRLHVSSAEPDGSYLYLGDSVVRLKMAWTERNIDGPLGIFFRTSTSPNSPGDQFQFFLHRDRLTITRKGQEAEQETLLEMPLNREFSVGEETSFEFGGIGETLYVRVDDQVGQIAATGIRPEGWVMIGGWNHRFRDVEYANLAGIDDPMKALGWEVPDFSSAARKLLIEARAHLTAGHGEEARALVEQALATAPSDLDTMAEAALLLFDAKAPEQCSEIADGFAKLASADHPQFPAITDLRVKLKPLLSKYQSHLEEAGTLLINGDDAGELRELRAAVELVPDGREAAERLAANPLHMGRPLPSRRWFGTLGHTYVPVEGLANVLFSTWETRVKDFEAFVSEAGYDMGGVEPYDGDKSLTWQNPGFEQTGDHPVVLVSRENAQAFCDWLTEKERAAGRLLPGQVYRLPTDREWSAAMGVLDEPGDFPSDRKFPENVFTWPKNSVPLRNAENLNWQNDDFRYTAPVGSGIANRFGIFDLLGNVGELCADPFDFVFAGTTRRGSAYNSDTTVWRSLIQDNTNVGRTGAQTLGFRCVLDLKSDEQRLVQTALEAAIETFGARSSSSSNLGRLRTLVSEEMVLLDFTGFGYVSDRELEPFAGLPITHLYNCSLGKDATHLAGFPLRHASFQILDELENLEGLRGLPLKWLNLEVPRNSVAFAGDLSPLADMELSGLRLANLGRALDLSPLRGMPLREFSWFHDYSQEEVESVDLTPLKDAPLEKVKLSASTSLEMLLNALEWWGGTATIDAPSAEIAGQALGLALTDEGVDRMAALAAETDARLKRMPRFQNGVPRESAAAVLNDQLRFAASMAGWLENGSVSPGEGVKSFKGNSYLLIPWVLDFDLAIGVAKAMGGHLVTTTTAEENQFVSTMADETGIGDGVWIGLVQKGKGHDGWKWVTGEPVALDNWLDERSGNTVAGSNSDVARLGLHRSSMGRAWLHYARFHRRHVIVEWDTPTPQPPVKPQ